ncbi:hypothetical protein LguiA_027104 [Lonicera macranthoides]
MLGIHILVTVLVPQATTIMLECKVVEEKGLAATRFEVIRVPRCLYIINLFPVN